MAVFQPIGIVAWVMGSRVRRETSGPDAPYAHTGSAAAGRILGIVATCMLAFFILLFLLMVVTFSYTSGPRDW
ncbi:MAG: hypothetical protein FWD59_08905 [Micrococcales bacterium]|nr:hypothetical protein [Micrococcales bacterium]